MEEAVLAGIDVKLVEISEDRPPGQMLDLIQVPEADMKLITRHSR